MSERYLRNLVNTLTDAFAILFLRRDVAETKLKDYGRMAESLQGLTRALDTQQRALDDSHEQIASRDQEIEHLRSEYALLQAKQSAQSQKLSEVWQMQIFRKLESIFTQLPTLRHAIEQGAEIHVNDVLDLILPLDELLHDMGFEPIGDAGAEVEFDAQYQRAVGPGARSLKSGDKARVRYVGYMHDASVVVKAQVSALKRDN